MATALVGIGSNLGDDVSTVRGAIEALGEIAGVDGVHASRLFRSRPIGGPGGQRTFVNAAAVLETSLAPGAVLKSLQTIEDRFGRTRSDRWSARTLDLDLLLYEDVACEQPDLTLPHPRMSYRRFVLEPAVEIAAEMRHPVLGCTLGELLGRLDTAPHYVAIGGLSRSTRAWLAGAIGRALAAPILAEDTQPRPAGESAVEHPPVPPLPQVLEFVQRASGLVHRVYWSAHPELRPLLEPISGGSQRDRDTPPAVSDFWIDQWRLWSGLWSPGEGASPAACGGHRQWLQMTEEHVAEIVTPKLVIWLDALAPLPPRMQENLPMCLNRLFQAPPYHALLRLEEGDPDRMLVESLAAIQSMEPLEGVVS